MKRNNAIGRWRSLALSLTVSLIGASQAWAASPCGDSRVPANRNLGLEAAVARLGSDSLPEACGQHVSTAIQAPKAQITFSVPLSQVQTDHGAAIIKTTPGAPVTSDQEGSVRQIVTRPSGLVDVVLTHHFTVTTLFGGLRQTDLKVGDTVNAGGTIGFAGEDRSFGPSYRLSRLLPRELFPAGKQTTFGTTITTPQWSISVDGWEGGAIALSIDGIYVTELNQLNKFTVDVQGMILGAHKLSLIGKGLQFPPRASVRLTIRGIKESPVSWTGNAVFSADINLNP